MRDLLASLLKQLLLQGVVSSEVASLYKRHANGATPLTALDCDDLLVDVLKTSSQSFLVVDALDESTNQDDQDDHDDSPSTLRLLDTLVDIMQRSQSACKLFITSRADYKARYDGLDATEFQLKAEDEDIEKYVEWWWGHSGSQANLTSDLKSTTLQKLKENAAGQYVMLS